MTLPGAPANKLGNRYETCRRFAPLPDAGVPPASEGRPAPATGGGASGARTLRGTAPPPPAVRPRRGRVGAKSYEERED